MEVVCAGEKDLDGKKHQKRRSSVFAKKSYKAQRNRYEEQDWNPRFHSLAYPEETLDNKTLQATTPSGHIGRGQAKAQTELTCAVCQAERILNMCENGYEIHIS